MNKNSKNAQINRILSDIEQFYKNLKEVEINSQNQKIIELAKKYCEDSKYWLEKKDLLSAFGCINYAHGLLDAYRLKL
jgi:hypothetical protein